MLSKTKTSTYDINFHLVFVTKYRKKVFQTPTQQAFMKDQIETIMDKLDLTIQQLEVMPDHVHLLFGCKPTVRPSDMIKSIKGVSSRHYFQAFPETRQHLWKGHLWSRSYFISTVGNVSKNIVDEYIKNQMTKAMQSHLKDSSQIFE